MKDTININIQIDKECWKYLKKISIDKETSLQKVIQEILEQFTNRRNKKIESPEE